MIQISQSHEVLEPRLVASGPKRHWGPMVLGKEHWTLLVPWDSVPPPRKLGVLKILPLVVLFTPPPPSTSPKRQRPQPFWGGWLSSPFQSRLGLKGKRVNQGSQVTYCPFLEIYPEEVPDPCHPPRTSLGGVELKLESSRAIPSPPTKSSIESGENCPIVSTTSFPFSKFCI